MLKNCCLFLFSLIIFTGCITNRSVPAQIFTNENYCKILPASFILYDSLIRDRISNDTIFSQEIMHRFSAPSRSVAADIGIVSLLTAFAKTEHQLQSQTAAEGKLEMIGTRQKISEYIDLASAEVTSVLSEINCEQGRANELKNHLQSQIEKRATKLTIYSILAGTMGTLLGGLFSLSDADDVYAEGAQISGAVVSGYLAIRSLKKKDIKAEFVHKRNHLADIEANPAISTIYPPMVWHFLTRENQASEQTPVVRATILDKWRELHIISETASQEQKERMKLLFGEGGMYAIEDIEYRISLINLLESEISKMNQELKQLQQELIMGYHPKK